MGVQAGGSDNRGWGFSRGNLPPLRNESYVLGAMRVIPHVERTAVSGIPAPTRSSPLLKRLDLADGPAIPEPPATPYAVPAEVEMIMSAMEAGGRFNVQRRAMKRFPWRVQASLRLHVDPPGHPHRVIYTRDIHARSLGFITSQRLPLGYGGVVDLPAADGTILSIACTLLRCRQATPGWYEGVVYFNREQPGIEAQITA